nr:DapH/DapD/GlmU-related protein [Alteromonas sp. C1M14]
MFSHRIAYPEALIQINAPTSTPKQKRQALKQLVTLSAPCWIEPEFFVAGPATVTFNRFVFANHNVTLLAQSPIEIGEGVFIGPNAVLSTYPLAINGVVSREIDKISIGHNAWIGANAIILPGVHVGCNAIVGANAVVYEDVPDNTVVTGAPASMHRMITE